MSSYMSVTPLFVPGLNVKRPTSQYQLFNFAIVEFDMMNSKQGGYPSKTDNHILSGDNMRVKKSFAAKSL